MPTRDEYAAIGDDGGREAVELVAALMDHSAAEREWIYTNQISSLEKSLEDMTERAESAERCLYNAKKRFLDFLFDDSEYRGLP